MLWARIPYDSPVPGLRKKVPPTGQMERRMEFSVKRFWDISL